MALLINNMTMIKTGIIENKESHNSKMCDNFSKFLSTCNYWVISQLCNNVTIWENYCYTLKALNNKTISSICNNVTIILKSYTRICARVKSFIFTIIFTRIYSSLCMYIIRKKLLHCYTLHNNIDKSVCYLCNTFIYKLLHCYTITIIIIYINSLINIMNCHTTILYI